MLGTTYPEPRLAPDDGVYLLQDIKDHLADGDLVIGNLEGTITVEEEVNKTTADGIAYAFRMPLHYAGYLSDSGFNMINIANNHAYDFGRTGILETIASLKGAGIGITGPAYHLNVREYRGIRVGIAGFYWKSHFNDLTDTDHIKKFLTGAAEDVDILVVTFHGGAEGEEALHTRNAPEFYLDNPRGNVVEFARTAIDFGADVVIGHGPHVPRAMEFYRDKLIAYSLGNFCTFGRFNMKGHRKYSLILELHFDSAAELISAKVIPVILKGAGVPFFDNKANIMDILRKLSFEDFPQTGIHLDDSGLIELPAGISREEIPE